MPKWAIRLAFAHGTKFPTAASCRSQGRVSVPVWLIMVTPPRTDSSFCSYNNVSRDLMLPDSCWLYIRITWMPIKIFNFWYFLTHSPKKICITIYNLLKTYTYMSLMKCLFSYKSLWRALEDDSAVIQSNFVIDWWCLFTVFVLVLLFLFVSQKKKYLTELHTLIYLWWPSSVMPSLI